MRNKSKLTKILNPREQDLKEQKEKGFQCINCGAWSPFNLEMGTQNRNHCPWCLFSQHIDLNVSGDRRASCYGKMKPIGLTFKQEGLDKRGKLRQGELMLVHKCMKCGRISINRIAGDDDSQLIINIFYKNIDSEKELKKEGIRLLSRDDEQKIKTQLYGKMSKN